MPLSISITTRLQYQHETIEELIGGLTEQELKQRVQPDKWSAFEQIAHLTAYQPTFLVRLHKIEAEEAPDFERYVADNDPAFHHCLQRPLPSLLEDLAIQRFIIANHVLGLPEETLNRTGRHPKYGLLTIPKWTEFFLLHEAHHLFSLFMLIRVSMLEQL